MGYIALTDLKKTKALSKQLESDPEAIVTRDGKPMAIMIGVDGDTVESSLQEIIRPCQGARSVDSSVTITSLLDPDDAPLPEMAAVSGDPLVTGKARHFPADKAGSIVVQTPRAFLTNRTARSISS